MNFNEEFISSIISGKKDITRRIVKEGEYLAPNNYKYEDSPKDSWICLKNKKGIAKWQVGKNYAVCLGRGLPCVEYCPDCKGCIVTLRTNKDVQVNQVIISPFSLSCCLEHPRHTGILKSLRVKVKSIRKERLLDISEADAKREGYKNCINFVENFAGLNAKYLPKEIKNLNGMIYPSLKKLEMWNPFVWRIEFEVVR